MEPILFLVHRIPFPPNKGDKIRSFHLLRYLAAHYRVFVGTFIDDAADAAHVGDVEALAAGVHVARLNPALARVRSLQGLLRGEALTLPYYRDRGLQRWVDRTVSAQGIRKVVVFSSAMAQYVAGRADLEVVADYCDVDSAKWEQYAQVRRGPVAWIYRREGRRLLAFERAAAATARATTFATQAEVELFVRLAPECRARAHAVSNGVDTAFYRPDAAHSSPYGAGEIPVAFTGAMDYWPNVDAVSWFVRDVLPLVAAKRAGVRFYVVGMNPAAEVRALAADPRVVVTGKVPDVRPYLQHARAVVAPLRVARGVQNKVLEAMAMARPVVATAACVAPLVATARAAILTAEDAAGIANQVLHALSDPAAPALGARARAAVEREYSWSANLQRFGELLGGHGSASKSRPQPAVDPSAADGARLAGGGLPT